MCNGIDVYKLNAMSILNSSIAVNTAFSVRVVVCDHYLTKPAPSIDVIYSEFRGSDIKQVPVLRIFGSAADGHKACLHIHGVFPYFYIPCPTPNPAPQLLYQIAASLDKALNIALKQATSSNQHVYSISLVKGLPFYGFHHKEHLYLKVFLYNPRLIRQAVELCSNGAILGQTLQPHESHLNFTLQFFIDFNLFGMSNIDLQAVKFRKKGSLSQNSDEPVYSPNDFILKAESVCHYEADCMASHIINRQKIGRGDGIENPGLEEVWNQEIERRKLLNMSLASKSLSQARLDSGETESHYKYEKMFWAKISNLITKPVDVTDDDTVCNEAQYPAETQEGSKLQDAVDISVHHPGNMLDMMSSESLQNDDTIIEDVDNTLVDESIAMNSSFSIKYSQVSLDTDDMDLVEMLRNMEDNSLDDDSILGTPCAEGNEIQPVDDDAEYSQIFNEDTIILNKDDSIDENTENDSPRWNDSFWDGANIAQLDGTCDDEHTKKVRKRKQSTIRLGLSRLKRNDKQGSNDVREKEEVSEHPKVTLINDEMINVKQEPESGTGSTNAINHDVIDEKMNSYVSVTDLVNKNASKYESVNVKVKLEASKMYDDEYNFIPIAGPSNVSMKPENVDLPLKLPLDSSSSEDENNSGIISFYNISKVFNTTLEKNAEINSSIENEDFNLVANDHSKNNCNVLVQNVNTDGFKSIILTPKFKPPLKDDVVTSLDRYNINKLKHPQPYYSNFKDVGDKVEVGQMVLKLKSKAVQDYKSFENELGGTSIEEWRQLLFLQNHDADVNTPDSVTLKSLLAGNKHCVLRAIKRPPTTLDVKKWIEVRDTQSSQKYAEDNKSINLEIGKNLDDLDNSQAIGLEEDTINNTISLESVENAASIKESLQITMQSDGSYLCFGHGGSQHENMDTSTVEVNFITLMILEVHTRVRGDSCPDPNQDSIVAVFLTITNDCPDGHFLSKSMTEVIIVEDQSRPRMFDRCVFNVPIKYVESEMKIVEGVIASVRRHNPDIMCGYEIEMNSWGYFIERSLVLGFEIIMELSRITEKYRQKRSRSNDNDIEGRIIGRITFNVWRLFRHELALSSYSFETCMYEILKERVPKYTYSQLSQWWNEESKMFLWIPIEYYLMRLSGTKRMLEKLDIINRTAELARLFGLQWWEVLSRGSQFRVESLMLRAARPLNLVALSPTVKQRAAMKAPECLPLILEPESRFYSDPVIVLDFQSLYPSMMIAYNYCFSTCIGRVQNINGESSYEFGAWRLRISQTKLEMLVRSGLVHWSPVGVGFVKPEVRRGVLPAMLRRILAARQAVKKSMKMQTDEAMKKSMHSRQLGLKLIANVTYGYTAANFSGRMPCVEVGDSVVAKGRETLERAIRMVENNSRWKAKVVYGDTDSMFVMVPGGTRAEAFQVGQEIADAVTADNPSPVALKLEKVYQPCILQTKKRYVGYMYESPDQLNPVYEAKGIETVRRDGCPAGVKVLQRSLCELFDSSDMSRIKLLVMDVLNKLVHGTMPLHELFFTREYNGPQGYRPGAAAPPAEIARRLTTRDVRSGPRTGERVSWLVCAGAPTLPLIKLARTPAELICDPNLRPHVAYYAARVLLPPLQRCLSLLGVNVFKWWNEIGYIREVSAQYHASGGGIARYLCRERCVGCGARAQRPVCGTCAGRPRHLVLQVAPRVRQVTDHVRHCALICSSCCGHPHPQHCTNTECVLLWRRRTAQHKLRQHQEIVKQLPEHLKCSDCFDF